MLDVEELKKDLGEHDAMYLLRVFDKLEIDCIQTLQNPHRLIIEKKDFADGELLKNFLNTKTHCAYRKFLLSEDEKTFIIKFSMKNPLVIQKIIDVENLRKFQQRYRTAMQNRPTMFEQNNSTNTVNDQTPAAPNNTMPLLKR